MTDQTREAALVEARAAVARAGYDPDSAGGAAALEFVLTGSITSPDSGGTRPPEPPETTVVESDPEARLAAFAGSDRDRIRDVVEFEGDELTIRIPAGRLARSKADRQRVLALLTVATDRVAYGIQEVPASRVNAICDDYSCLDQNVPQNVARGGLLARRGKRGAYTYRATQPGLERAKTLLKELVEGDGALRL